MGSDLVIMYRFNRLFNKLFFPRVVYIFFNDAFDGDSCAAVFEGSLQ